jgi:acetolactate synthase-1/3 small subunit/acetolactate synthase II small subunit
MTQRLEIDFAMAEGAMLRMLGLIERRGFEVCGLSMSGTGREGALAVDLSARDSGRGLEVMAGQLRRLTDVRHVRISNQGSSS